MPRPGTRRAGNLSRVLERVTVTGYVTPLREGGSLPALVEAGEDYYAAARRELAEETGWTDVPVAPGEVHEEEFVQWSWLSGVRRLVRQRDHYFVARVADDQRPLGDVAAMHVSDGIHEARWWTRSELDATDQAVYPVGLAGLLRRLS